MIGYILFYELPIIIRWQWRLCCAMSAMSDYPDFSSYGWQWRLCRVKRHFLCSNCIAVILLKVWQDNRRDMSLQRNCVAVMLLKARGWRGTSLPRVNDNAWFSNPVRVSFLPITWWIRKSWTRSGFISCVHFIPTLAHFARQRGAFKNTTRTELRIWKTIICITHIRLLRAQLFHAYRWQWMLCRAMRYFPCSNCIADMLLKVWQDNRRDMSL